MNKTLIFFFALYYGRVSTQTEINESIEYTVTELSGNSDNSDIAEFVASISNFYNYTIENQTTGNGDAILSTVVMKISSKGDGKKYEVPERVEMSSRNNSNSNLVWIAQPLHEGLKNFKVTSKINEECNFQSDLFQIHLKNQTLWAVRMAESFQTEATGILGGTTYQMGNFEECIKTKAYGIRGKYCLANFKYGLADDDERKYRDKVADEDYKEINHESSVWEGLVRLKKDPVRIDRQDLYWGICFPAGCSAEDVESSLNRSLIPRFHDRNLLLNISVEPIFCHTEDWLPFTTGFWVTMTFMTLLLLINILSTFYDGYEYLKGRYKHDIEGWRELVGVFSLYRNTYNLGIYNKKTQVKIVNGMKILMMVLIIYGHSLLYILGYPQFNPEGMEEVYRRGADIALVNTNIVDVFLTISGFLTFFYGYRPMKIGGVAYLLLSIFFRYLRLMPVFAIVIAYVAFVLPYTSDGPIWNARISVESDNCRNNWWLDLLLLNNFFNVDEQCVLISWYITTDMLLCTIASALIYVIIKKPKFGLILTVFCFLSSIVITFMVTYVNRYNGLLKLYVTLLTDPRKSVEYKDLYTALYSRVGPYLVGFLTAYLTIKLQEKKFKFSKKVLFIGCVLSIAIGEGSQYYGVVFYKFGRPFNLLENALYACLHRILFAGLFSWFLLAYLTTGFGIIDSIINHRIFTVLGRMTYSVFLMNTLSLITLTASIRNPIFYSYKMIMFIVFGDIITTYVLGFMFYLYAEAPICGISKVLQKQLAKMFKAEIEKASLMKIETAGKPVENGIVEIKKSVE